MIKDKVSTLFGYPMGEMSFAEYLDFMNKSGKITPRSLMDLITVTLEALQETEDDRRNVAKKK